MLTFLLPYDIIAPKGKDSIMKKALSIILIISILSVIIFSVNVSGEGRTKYFGCLIFTEYDTYCKLTGCHNNAFGSVIIPSEVEFDGKLLPVTAIGSYAFVECEYIEYVTDITIPDSVTTIEEKAFYGCTGLKTVEMPGSVISIGFKAFENCDSLIYNENGGCLYLGNENNPYLALISAKDASITGAVINEKTRVIAGGAFLNCSDLKSASVPYGVTSICEFAFSGCGSLADVEIPDSVTVIGDSAFSQCSAVTSVIIPESVTEIGPYAFYGCGSLKTVYFKGSAEQWRGINISDYGNGELAAAGVVFNYIGNKPGDMNGDGAADNKDVVLLFRYVSFDLGYDPAYDFDGDGEVNNKDVVALFRSVSAAK